MLNSTVGKRTKAVRLRLGLTQYEFAKKLSVSDAFVSMVEKAKNQPGKKMLTAMTNVFNVNINWVLTGQGTMFTPQDSTLSVKEPVAHYGSPPGNPEIDDIITGYCGLDKHSRKVLREYLAFLLQKKR